MHSTLTHTLHLLVPCFIQLAWSCYMDRLCLDCKIIFCQLSSCRTQTFTPMAKWLPYVTSYYYSMKQLGLQHILVLFYLASLTLISQVCLRTLPLLARSLSLFAEILSLPCLRRTQAVQDSSICSVNQNT